MKIIFLGAPGAGKGTQADKVSRLLDIPTISTGAIIREAIGIVKERLTKSDCGNGYILDGFPRTVPQAEALEEMGITLDAVVSLEVSDETIVERMCGRRVCPSCGATYHTKDNPSADGVRCDKCQTELTVRSDDAPEVVLSRLNVYHNTTEPLKAFYESRGLLRTVIGAERVEETTKRTLESLGIN